MATQLLPKDMLQQVAERFRLLGEPVRLQMLNHLNIKGEMNVQELIDATGQQQANVSKHLKIMTQAGLVSRRKEGLYVYYSIADASISGLCLLVCGQLQNQASSVEA